jgi:prepilin-type N-terminal cleavage/methylation domain-containing protein
VPGFAHTVCADRRGLTLVEMLIVLIVIGVLLAVAVPSYLGMRDRANDAVARNDLMQGRVAAHAYFVESESFADLDGDVLRSYDAELPERVTVGSASAGAYCLQTTVGGRTWALHGPAAMVWRATCAEPTPPDPPAAS